jgi:hypothetical protein
MKNTLSKFHIVMNQRPLKFCPETNKKTAFFIIERLEVSNGSKHFDLTLLSPLASFLKVFRPTQITQSDFLDTIVPFDKTKDKNTTHRFSPITTSRITTKNYTHLVYDRSCRLNGLLQFFGVPKIKVLALEKQNNKTQIQTKPKHRLLRRVIGHSRDL